MGNWGKINGKRVNEVRNPLSQRRNAPVSMQVSEMDSDDEESHRYFGSAHSSLDRFMLEYVEAFNYSSADLFKSQTGKFLEYSGTWLDQLGERQEIDNETIFLAGRVFLVGGALNCINKNMPLTSRCNADQVPVRAAIGLLLISSIAGVDEDEVQEQLAHAVQLFRSPDDFSIVFDEVAAGIDRDPDFIRHLLASMR